VGNPRLDWDEYFMRIAWQVAERSTCCRASVGAVLVRDRSILATGYNGSPSGMPHCTDVGCLIYRSVDADGDEEENCFRTIHAEINAIAQAAANGTAIRGADIYITHSPCYHCGKVLINAGIRRIHYAKPYKLHLLERLLKSSPIELIQILEPTPTEK
jgi:dCMP deaminase